MSESVNRGDGACCFSYVSPSNKSGVLLARCSLVSPRTLSLRTEVMVVPPPH